MDHPRPGLRYVDASDLDDSKIKFNRLEVQGIDGQKLGTVEGFIIDRNSARPYYVVVDAGGWFKSKHFLAPIGHIAFAPGDSKLVADLTKDRVKNYPGFDKSEFKKMSEDELKMMDDQMWTVCVVETPAVIARYEHEHYCYPTWWEADFYNPNREPEGVGPRGIG